MNVAYLCSEIKFELKLKNMKRFFLMAGILVSTAFLLSSFSLRENPQDPPRGKKKERHIKLVKVGEDGNRMELDTVLANGDVFVWNGDTIGGKKQMTWFSEGHFEPDSMFKDMSFDFEIDDDDEGRVFVMKPGGKSFAKSWAVVTGGDSAKAYKIRVIADDLHGGHDVMLWHGDKGENQFFAAPEVPGVPPVPPVPGLRFFERGNSENIIDLSDPGIISYKKKKMKDGREKITIIRNEPDEKDVEKVEEIIIDGKGNHSSFWGSAPKARKVFVTKEADGRTEISEDGKVIRIKEIKEGDEKNVEVEEVEVEESRENN